MSAIGVDRDSLKEFCDKYPELLEKLDKTSGLYRSFAFHVFEESILNKEEIMADPSPYRFVTYKVKENYLNYYRDQVFMLLERELTREIFGLSIMELFNMDYSTFSIIKKKVMDLQKRKLEDMEKLKHKGPAYG